jgi:hypothetical protein
LFLSGSPILEFLMGPRAQFVCQSSVCRRQAEIAMPTGSEGGQISNPRCTCGWEMKRVYFKPVFQKLSKAEAMMRLRGSGFS